MLSWSPNNYFHMTVTWGHISDLTRHEISFRELRHII